MIDIHSHILHNMDDGASSFSESVQMVELAAQTGTTDIVATPHANLVYSYQPHAVEQCIGELQQAIGDKLRIHRGCDFHLSFQNIQQALRDPTRFSINGLNYLLVEFPEVSKIQGLEQIFAELRAVGLIPIITHPERNPYLASDLDRLRRWVKNGAYVQLTAQSLLGSPWGLEVAKWSREAIEMGLVHFVASDAHDTVYRPCRLDKAGELLEREFGEQYAELILEIHPRAVLCGHVLDTGLLPRRRRDRKWFIFGN
jgi:protein-tyrosine phosphatase